jgi:hypothetical protein
MAHKTWKTVEDSWVKDGVTYTSGLTCLQASHPDIAGPPRFVGGDQCSVCGFTYPRDQLEYFQGRPFCRARGCNGNIKHYKLSGKVRMDIASFEPL